jgi:hypothetical protein
MNSELTQIAGITETDLSADMLARLPADAPAAPWRARAEGIVWWGRPGSSASAAIRTGLPPLLRRAQPLSVITAILRYSDTPVGGYDEILTMLVLRQGRSVFTHVPFIAVSSPASVVGGRANWALPKTLATFTGRPVDDTEVAARGDNWLITATAHSRGRGFPLLLPPLSRLVQIDGRGQSVAARLRGTGRARPARVTVEVSAPDGLAAWLPQGSCAGLVLPEFAGYLPKTSPTRVGP